jgi:hypothetical protein
VVPADDEHQHVQRDEPQREIGKTPTFDLRDEDRDKSDEHRRDFKPPGEAIEGLDRRPSECRCNAAEQQDVRVGFQKLLGLGKYQRRPSTFGALALP